MSRQDDEMLLTLLNLYYRKGLTHREIGNRMNMTARLVSSRIQKVREQDCKHDPEARDYWRTRT